MQRCLPRSIRLGLVNKNRNMKPFLLERASIGLCLPLVVSSFLTPLERFVYPTTVRSYHSSASTSLKMSADKMDQSFPTWRMYDPCTTMEWNSLVSAEAKVVEYAAADGLDEDLVIVGLQAPPKEDEEDEDQDAEASKPPVVLSGAAKTIDEALGGALTDVVQEANESFQNGAQVGDLTPLARIRDDGKFKKYAVVGLGHESSNEEESKNTGSGSKMGSALAKLVSDQKEVTTVRIILNEDIYSETNFFKDFASSLYQALYADNRYRTGKKVKPVTPDLQEIVIACPGVDAASAQNAMDQGKLLAQGVLMTKDIVNAPHNVLNSLSLAETAQRIAKDSDCLTCEILDAAECEARGMGAYLGVARGSETPPQFIHMTYKPKNGDVQKRVGVVGKGLLFDTGGYNIKTAMMELMKFDCGGAAAVLGAARAVGALQPPNVEAHFVVAACENMINDKSMVPSDILTASNGKTIEVMNTDAEGRLTLADALVFCDKELDCESIIELSTLTGACMISLGQEICGLWTDSDDLASELEDISKTTGEKSWRMPMAKEYNKQLESKFADLKNIGTRYGGSITAALFLQNFVSAKKPYAHIDIAGPVWSDAEGATGFGAKLVTEWVTRQGQSDK